MEEENPKKFRIWIWLIPVYIALLIPLGRWTMKIYSPDVELSREDISAFSGEGKIEKDDYQVREPNLEDIAFAINYKNQGSASGEDDPYQEIEKKSSESEKTYASSNKKESADTQSQRSAAAREKQEKYDSQVDQAKKSQMMSVGYRQGFLTKSVGGLMNNPSAVKALFNNSFVVNGFMGRETVKSALANPKALENFLTKSDKVSNFLSNDIVKKALGNQQVVSAIASSSLVGEILKSQAVQGLLSDSNAMSRILDSNPQLMPLLGNPNVTGALMSNPQTAQAMMNIQGSGQIPGAKK